MEEKINSKSFDHACAEVSYSDERFVLEKENGEICLKVGGERYTLTCHPYEPCLYITDESGFKTAVHNSFDPAVVFDIIKKGGQFSSITGFEYDAKDFCRMVEYAAKMGDVGIEIAEKVFGDRPKKKTPANEIPKKEISFYEKNNCTDNAEAGAIITDDPFFDVLIEYPDIALEYCLVKNENTAKGYNAHRTALACACRKLMAGEDEVINYDLGRAKGRRISADEFFTAVYQENKLVYRKAFLFPPHRNNYTGLDFVRVNKALFPEGTDNLEIYEWTTDWSEYFDEGHEWWGTFCCSIYDKSLDRFVVIMASATD